MIKGIFAAGVLATLLLPVIAHAQSDYCSAPAGYTATNCFGDTCEYATDAFYDGYIGPSLDVSSSAGNCAPLTSWPYYRLTSQPGTIPTNLQVSAAPAADPPNPAPEISADDALAGLTLMAGLVLVGRGRRLTQ